ncbi:p450-domain-containing protein [Laetiporus sulphureus 93-53]|uniref:p450-domain-containing protein n=1 Tax=Laetiporus sulphureus 93-53 TaxID=1314785 RepID=A0A165ICR3_9APHY|nr:p450-domain-containing protein [Laetiporus sulphureus 93-53]KZT12900.1 p450-domain-containing protein [Laetiporus sulphureus 93-53]
MICYPDVQRKAQEEIDTVIGGERLPELADRERLPYVNAVCLEVLRWQPVTPLGVAHRLIQDDMHAGYHLPRGTIIYTNVWKCCMILRRTATQIILFQNVSLKHRGKKWNWILDRSRLALGDDECQCRNAVRASPA